MHVTRHPLAADCIAFAREVRTVLNESQLALYGQIIATAMIFALAWTARADGTTALYVIGAIWTVRVPELAEAWLRVRSRNRQERENIRSDERQAERQRAPVERERGE
jgi:hypothetical protein